MSGGELKKLIMLVLKEEISSKWNNWIQSMVSTVEEEITGSSMDVGEAYDIIKTNFRADAPNVDMFNKACTEALKILKSKGEIH